MPLSPEGPRVADRAEFWNRLSLAWRFAIVSFVVLLCGMLLIGWWVSNEIQRGVVQNTATATALYMNSFVAPEIAELEHRAELAAETQAALTRLHRGTPLAERIVSFKIWGRDGLVLYSSRPGIAGRRFPVTDDLEQAWQGKVTADFSDLEDEEDTMERPFGRRLLEIYSPVRAKGGDRVIAVAEFYATVSDLEQDLFRTRLLSWLVVAAVTFGMFAALFVIVRGGSETILRQQRELRTRIDDLSLLLRQNARLHQRVQRANDRAVEINERFLRRVSAELHDGPAQALGFALLRLDAIAETGAGTAVGSGMVGAGSDIDTIRQALAEALGEIRNLSSGLALPELEDVPLGQSLQRLLRNHERRSATRVAAEIETLPEPLPLALKIGVYRFVQEALHNASRHGGGVDQRVRVGAVDGRLEVTVSDNGPGFDPGALHGGDATQLGLAGMRERVESLGGEFLLDTGQGKGTRVTALLPLPATEGEVND